MSSHRRHAHPRPGRRPRGRSAVLVGLLGTGLTLAATAPLAIVDGGPTTAVLDAAPMADVTATPNPLASAPATVTAVRAATPASRARVRTTPAKAAGPAVVRPLAGGYRLTARYGERSGRWSLGVHTGLDFAASTGTPVVAAAAGVVREAGREGAYGRRVVIMLPDGTETTYNHLSAIGVRVGERVAAGERVGRVGASGNTTGAHLHFEVLAGPGRFVDPLSWLLARGVRA